MAFTAQDLAAIDAAIASGELTIRTEQGRMVTMRSMDELIKARDLVVSSLNAAAAPAGRSGGPRHLLADFSDD